MWQDSLADQLTNLLLYPSIVNFCYVFLHEYYYATKTYKVSFLHTGFYSHVLTVCMHGAIAGDAYMQ